MSFLRRRFGGAGDGSSLDVSREPSPAPTSTSDRPANLRLVTAEQLQTLKSKAKGRRGKRTTAWIFGLGGLFGLCVAAFFAGNNEMIDLRALQDVNLESVWEALPAAFVTDAQRLQVRALFFFFFFFFRPGGI